jgi:WD repeat-containing protein 24
MYISNQGKIMRKLLGKPTIEHSNDTSVGSTSSPQPAVYRPTAAQNASYNAGVPIACFDRSPDGSCALLGGRHILKTVKFDGVAVRDVVDLRAYITSQPTKLMTTTSTSDQLSIRDVAWTSSPNDTTIFTACANGKIFQYDLASLGARTPGGAGLEFIQMREDTRQVNTLDVNPHRGTLLLSGSQDGFIRMFDIRMPIQTRTGITFQSKLTLRGNTDAVRQVKWSSKDGMVFATASETGAVLRWDVRKHPTPTLRIVGHDKACTSISWHPDGEHLVTAGWDNKCHVWDVSKTAEKRQKPKWTITTPAPVAAVSWRPGQWSATAQGRRAAQIAVSYDESSQRRHGISAVHIWDFARPTMPYKEIAQFDVSPSDMMWQNQDILWTAGQDGLFTQCDVAFAPKTIDRTSMSSIAFSPRGDVAMLLDERPPRRRLRPQHVAHADFPSSSSFSSSPTIPMLSISRSDSEDDVVGSFLGSRRRASKKRRPSLRSAHGMSTTPPSGSGGDDSVVSLQVSLNLTGMYRPQQAMAIGPVPSTAKVDIYGYLSKSYLETLASTLPFTPGDPPMPERVVEILETYARAAENVSQFRLAQTWRILAYAMNILLCRRGQYHLEQRQRRSAGESPVFRKWDGKVSHPSGPSEDTAMTNIGGEETPRKVLSSTNLNEKPTPLRSLLSEEIESTSNVPTPLVRPVRDDDPSVPPSHDSVGNLKYTPGKRLTPVLESESFTLPPGLRAIAENSRKRLDSVPLSEISQGSDGTHASTEGYDFYDTASLAKAIDVPQSKSLVKDESPPLNYPQPRSPPTGRKQVTRQESDESFAQMFSISQQSVPSNSSGGSVTTVPSKFETIIEKQQPRWSGGVDEEYESRIRGKQMEPSPGSSQLGVLHRTLHRSNTDVTESTDESYRMTTQTTSGSLQSQSEFTQSMAEKSSRHRASFTPARSVATSDGENPDMIAEADYVPWPKDPPYPHPVADEDGAWLHSRSPALHPHTILTRALRFETRSGAVNAAAIILLLKPLVPDDVIDQFQAAAILRQHHSRLMGMKLYVEAALLRKLCVKGWPGGALSDWGENYTAVFAQALHGVSVKFLCPTCRKPREIDRTSKSTETVWQCERCQSAMGPCAVCGHREAAQDTLSGHESARDSFLMSTWWYCHGCRHGGHSSCLEAWHSTAGVSSSECSPLIGTHHDTTASAEFSDGACPMDGCGHACLPGRYRVETAAARTEEVTRAAAVAAAAARLGERERTRSLEIGSLEVGASRAVESVRESLAGGGDILSSSPGREGGRDRERRKSVKFAGTESRRGPG